MYEVPDMITEVVSAIEEKYAGQDLIDCMLWLSKTSGRVVDQNYLRKWFLERSLCPECGEKLRYDKRYNVHTQCAGMPMEMYYEIVCPNCGVL